MSEMTFDSAAAALANAASADAGEQAAPVSDASTTVEQGTNQSSESFTQFDINSVPDNLRPHVEAAYKQLQADYTRKTQEVAPFRKALESTGYDLDQAQQALQFTRSLADPNVQRELYDRLNQQFGQQQQVEFEGEDEYGSVDPRDRALQDLQSRVERFEQQQHLARAEAELDRMESVIRQQNPNFQDADIERIQKIAFAHNGNLLSAADEYKSWQQSLLSSYVNEKGSANIGGSPLAGTTHAQTPGTFGDLNEATKAALARFANEFAN